MISISTRIWAGVLSAALLPMTAVAGDGDKDANAPANKNAAAATTGATSTAPAANAAPATGLGANTDPLLRLLVNKGVLNAVEANGLMSAPANQMHNRLLLLLKDKGVLSAEDLGTLNNAPSTTAAGTDAQPGATATETVSTTAATDPQQHSGPPQPPKSAPSGPVPAVAPVRVLTMDPPKREGLIPDISIGKNIHIKPYGFFKTSVAYDTQSPYGNDFPLPGFIGDINGPDNLSEFHIKARSLRLGSNFEWLDISPNVVVTGKVEIDFEGNFSRVNNRNISAIRSNAPQIRLGYGRVDWKHNDTDFFILAGQDWTPFASSTLPNLFESTGVGLGFGTLYERDPQVRFGFNQKLGGDRNWQFGPEFAVVLPAFGNLPANLADQLGDGERQGVDSGQPELQARLVTQFQLDRAPNVAPAQIIVSGVHSDRSVVVLASAVPAAFKAAFPTGARVDSTRNAWTGEIQLPTRWFTLVSKYYNGSDLRYFFGGQLLGPFNDTTGLTGTATAPSIDGSSTLVFGNRAGVPVLANSLPPRSQGGFVNLGLPLSRWANADPQGRNAGWVMYLHYGYDQVLARDVRRLGGGRMKGDLFAPQLQYKLNSFVTFAVEESLYRTRAIPLTATGNFPLFAGRPQRETHDFRSEFGTIFTF